MSTLIQDLRYALRALAKSPGFTAAAVVTLALGIGANTAIFSVVDGVLLRPAPFADMDRLVMVWETDRASGTTREPASIPDFADFRQRSTQLQRVAALWAIHASPTPLSGPPTRVPALAVSHEFLPMLGLQPLSGRAFLPEEDVAGGPPVVIISAALRQDYFSRDADAVGRTIRISEREYTIVGVMPEGADFGVLQLLRAAAYSRGFADRFDRTRVDLWFPLQVDPAQTSRDNHPILVLGRLAPGASLTAAQDEMTRIASDLEQAYPEANEQRGVHLEAVADVVFGPVRPALFVLLGAVALVLLVACGNVANLLLVRGAERLQEVAVRAALGAGGARLTRQFLIESTVLTLAGGVLGVALAWGALRLLLAIAPSSIPRVETVSLDGRVLAVTLVLSLAVAAVAGLVPAFQAFRLDLANALHGQGSRGGSASREQRRVRSALVVAELALAVMLMVGAGLLIRSLWRLQQVDLGFETAGVLKAEFLLPGSRYPQRMSDFPAWPELRRFHADAVRELAALPGVTGVTIAGRHPLDRGFTSSIVVVGREAEAHDWPEPSIRLVDERYVTTLGVPVITGRAFLSSDDAAGTPVILVNQEAQQRYFAGRDPLGQRIRLWGAERTVVGVLGGERFLGQAEAAPPAVYLPTGQSPVGIGSIMVRSTRDPATLVAAVRRVIHTIDPEVPLFGVEPLAQTLANSASERRFTTLVLGAFAAVALVLALVGVHGVLSYSVACRHREIGIRMALGADRKRVRSLVLGEGVRLAVVGLALGILGALALTGVLRTMLYGVGQSDLLTFTGVALTLGAVAVLASWLPARRATGVDPIIALRSE
jgi:putative ABC transport system permease protein